MKRLAIAVLVGFHGILLWRRILDASIAQPEVLAKWIAAIVLTVALLSIRNARGAFIVVWLLVAMLHVGVPGEIVMVLLAVALPATFLFTLDASWFVEPIVFAARIIGRTPQLGRSPPAA